jgi:dTMP kinase
VKGRLIVIEGTDCSGKQTQTEMLLERLEKEERNVMMFSFPAYDTATGKIVGGSYLGKQHIGPGYFEEGAANVDPKVASLFYAADRLYNINKIKDMLEEGYDVLVDRYVFSNMAHQGGKITNNTDRFSMYQWLDDLEFKLLELPKPDITILLYMPYEYSLELKKKRQEQPDQHESNEEHLRNAERAYLELARSYNWNIVNCVSNNQIRTVNDISDDVYNTVKI